MVKLRAGPSGQPPGIRAPRCLGTGLRIASLLLLLALGCAGEEKAEAPRVARLELEPSSLDLFSWQKGKLEARAWDENGAVVAEPPVRWRSSAPDRLSVDGNGSLLALAPGEARVEASIGEVRAHATVRIREARLARIAIEPRDPKLIEGESLALEATVYDEEGRPYAGLPIQWSSSAPLYASVDETGVVEALWKDRTATITATHGALSDSVEVQILAPVFRLELEPGRFDLLEGETATVEATILDTNLEPMAHRPIAFSSDNEEIVRVDAQGKIEAIAPGTTRIRASITERETWAPVVVKPRAKRLDLSLSPPSIRVDGRAELQVVARDKRGAVIENIPLERHAEDAGIAHFLGASMIQGLAPGSTRIVVGNEDHGVEASISLEVREAAHLRLLGPSVWAAGDTFSLELEIEEGGELVPPRDPVWFSLDESVAVVDQEGRVELVGVGRASVGVHVEGWTLAIAETSAVRFTEMALGRMTSCGLAANGSVWCWGRKLVASGGEVSLLASPFPERVAENIVAIRSGEGACDFFPEAHQPVCDITYGLDEEGGVLAFHLGLPPKVVHGPPFSTFDTSHGNVCGVLANGGVDCIGTPILAPHPVDALFMRPQGHCLLGDGTMECAGTGPFDVDLSPWSFALRTPFPVATSSTHGCALTDAGEALCWGENEWGQVDEPPEAESWLAPREVAEGIRSLAAVEGASILVTEAGETEVRGMDRILLGSRLSACLEDALTLFPRQGEIRAVYSGPGDHRCLLLESGRPYCWGANDFSQAGYKKMMAASNNSLYDVPVIDPLSPYPEDPYRFVTCSATGDGGLYACVLHSLNSGYDASCPSAFQL